MTCPLYLFALPALHGVHTVAPMRGENLPAKESESTLHDAALRLWRPAEHCSHAPPAAEYVPFSHSQLPVIGLGSVPLGQLRCTQSLGFVLPTALNVPLRQALQALLAVAPVPELYVFAGHSRHEPREAWPESGL